MRTSVVAGVLGSLVLSAACGLFPDVGGLTGEGGGSDAAIDVLADASATDASDASGIVAFSSCAPGGAGRTTCGDGGETCCASLPVTGGTYDRTYTNKGSGATGKADPATVASFRLDKYAVTVGRFRQFVSAWNNGTGWTPPAGSGKHIHLNGGQGLENSASPGTHETGWVTSDNTSIVPTNTSLSSCSPSSTWTNTAMSQEKLPINCVNWYESVAFCIWDGGFLPSGAEWEYAAAGGSQERQYPWGTASPGTASQYAIYGCNYPSPGSCKGVSNIAPVGTPTSGAGLWGQLDLAGNVWEWNLDYWHAAYVTPCANCADVDLSMDSPRVIRGGDFLNGPWNLLPPLRNFNPPTNRRNNIGFRCARTP